MLGADRHKPPGLARLQGSDSGPSLGGTRDKGALAPVSPQCVRRMGLCCDPQALTAREGPAQGRTASWAWPGCGSLSREPAVRLLPALGSTPWSGSMCRCLCVSRAF